MTKNTAEIEHEKLFVVNRAGYFQIASDAHKCIGFSVETNWDKEKANPLIGQVKFSNVCSADVVVLHHYALFRRATSMHGNPDRARMLPKKQSLTVAAIMLEMTAADMKRFLQT